MSELGAKSGGLWSITSSPRAGPPDSAIHIRAYVRFAHPINVGCRRRASVTIYGAEQPPDDLTMTLESAADRFRRQAEECELNARKAMRPLDREAWLRLAADWAKLAQGAELVGEARAAAGRIDLARKNP